MLILKLHEEDYFDEENNCFVLRINTNLRQVSTVVTVNHNGFDWECYLQSVSLAKAEQRGRRDMYIITYKIYEQ